MPWGFNRPNDCAQTRIRLPMGRANCDQQVLALSAGRSPPVEARDARSKEYSTMSRELYEAPFYMIITDQDNGTFSAEDAARNWLQRSSGKQVLPGEIVHL